MRRVAFSLVTLCACFAGSSGGSGGGTESGSSGTHGGTASGGGTTGSGTATGGSSTGVPADCDPTEAPGEGIFVHGAAGDDAAGQGTALLPFASISKAMEVAKATGAPAIFVHEGTYAEALVVPDLPGGLMIRGGWVATGASWALDCSPGVISRTVVAAPATTSVAVTVENVTHTSGMRMMTVATQAAGDSFEGQHGESLVGVLLRGAGTVFDLTEVDVLVGNGGAGGTALNGSDGAPGDASCNGPCEMGFSGTTPNAGEPAMTSGTFGPDGYAPAGGAPGSGGTLGQRGTAPTMNPATRTDCYDDCMCINNGSTCGSASGQPTSVTGGTGTCGCAGTPGEGGAGGPGGGAAVGVMVVGSGTVLAIAGGSVSVGDGGAGAAGGTGGSGGPGAAGMPGAAALCYTGCATGGGPCANCYNAYEDPVSGGGAGGPGGSGGSGSEGGAGSGGPSYAIVKIGGGSVYYDAASTTMSFGAPGLGATGTAGKAADGDAALEHTVP